MKKIFFLFASIFLLMGCNPHDNSEDSAPLNQNQGLEQNEIQIGDQTFSVEIAQTPRERMQGLMFRDSMPEGTGMLFIFEQDNIYTFWMKNTLIPLDIAWISADKKVVATDTMEPCLGDPCPSYDPGVTARYVLEVNAGELDVEIGDTLVLPSS